MRTDRNHHVWRAGGAVGLLSAIALLVAACGGGGGGGSGGTGSGTKGPQNSLISCPSSTNTSAASAESGAVNLVAAGWSSSPAEEKLVRDGIATFEQQHPNIKVSLQLIPGDYATKMRANVASGNVPDVFYIQPPMAQEYVTGGKLLNLSPYLAKDNISASSYYDSLLAPFDCADGTVFGVPKDWNSLGLFYNKSLLQKAGVDTSNITSWTWDDLKSAAQKATKGGVVGLSLPADASRWGAFLFANGGKILANNGQQAAFNSDQGVSAMQFYAGFVKNGSAKRPSDMGAGWDGDAFGQQKAAMTFEGGWMIPFMSQTFPKVQYNIAPLPKAPDGSRGNLTFTNAWGASAGTKHPEAAWEFIKFMTGQAYQSTVMKSGFALPTLKAMGSDPYFTSHPDAKVLQDGANYGKADFYGPADDKIHTQISNAIEAVMLGKSDAKAALNSAAQNVNTFIQQNS